MALGKNFRLPLDVKPTRYSAHLAPDLAKGTFEGRMELEVRLERPRREIHLHTQFHESVEQERALAGERPPDGLRLLVRHRVIEQREQGLHYIWIALDSRRSGQRCHCLLFIERGAIGPI